MYFYHRWKTKKCDISKKLYNSPTQKYNLYNTPHADA